MWTIKSTENTFKTFNIDKLYNYIINSKQSSFEFLYNYQPISKAQFLKKFLIISGDYDMYLDLEKKLISDKAKKLWVKMIKK